MSSLKFLSYYAISVLHARNVKGFVLAGNVMWPEIVQENET
jgi:hypothetical protein